MIELFIEGYKVDIDQSFSTMITLAIDDVKDFDAKNTSFSKTIIIPGTKNNNKIFGNVFDNTRSFDYDSNTPNINVNFNPSVGARAYIFSSNMQVFKGVFRIMGIIIDNNISYECAVFGELGGFVAKMGNLKLEELDFSSKNHTYNLTNIVNSWDGASGYYYPLIDYGNYSPGKKHWQVKTLRPALYAKDYIDKIFEKAGYGYNCDFFNTDKFKSLVIPHNQKVVSKFSSNFFLGRPTYKTYNSSGTSMYLEFTGTSIGSFTIINSGTRLKNNGSSINTDISFDLTGIWNSTGVATINIRRNGVTIASSYLGSGGAYNYFSKTFTAYGVTLDTNDYIEVTLDWSTSATYILTAMNGYTNMSGDKPSRVEVNINESLVMNDCIPLGILQKDFLSSIITMNNLYLFEDYEKDKILNIKPFPDFYKNATSVDWSLKLDRSKPMTITPMGELNARYFNFEFKSDNDYYNEIYQKRYNENYGSFRFDTQFEFVVEEKKASLIFSGTPIVGYAGEEKVYPTIFKRTGNVNGEGEENIDSNIRILQTKKLTSVASWNILNGATVLGSYTSYPYAGHFDDPDAPNDDIGFGTPKELFFTLTTGNLDNNSFKRYWQSYMDEITDKDSRIIEAWFKLNSKDVYQLDFAKLIYIDGSLFRLNKVIDFNALNPSVCKVQLLKIVNLSAITSGLPTYEDAIYEYTGNGTEGNTLYVEVNMKPILVIQGYMILKKVIGTPGVGEYSYVGSTYTFGAAVENEQNIFILYN